MYWNMNKYEKCYLSVEIKCVINNFVFYFFDLKNVIQNEKKNWMKKQWNTNVIDELICQQYHWEIKN